MRGSGGSSERGELAAGKAASARRVLKGRYYPDTEFVQATVPHSASATWRAIVAGREVLKLGLLRRIGDGTSVNVWTDKWIPTTATMIPTERPPGATVAFASELIDTYAGAWRVDQVRENFAAPDAEAILNIPLRRGGGPTFWLGRTRNLAITQSSQLTKP
ncbi:Alanyl-tRNA synthetase [Hordeum vulgare]|nr:Alanyl-tRNA synthetase [Hordeum vulgare]